MENLFGNKTIVKNASQSYQGEEFGKSVLIFGEFVKEMNRHKLEAITEILISEGADYEHLYSELMRFYAGLFLSLQDLKDFCHTYFGYFSQGVQDLLAVCECYENGLDVLTHKKAMSEAYKVLLSAMRE